MKTNVLICILTMFLSSLEHMLSVHLIPSSPLRLGVRVSRSALVESLMHSSGVLAVVVRFLRINLFITNDNLNHYNLKKLNYNKLEITVFTSI